MLWNENCIIIVVWGFSVAKYGMLSAKGGIEDWDDLQDVQRTVLDVIGDWAFDSQAISALNITL